MEKINFYLEYSHKWIDHPLTFTIHFDDRLIHVDQGHAYNTINKKVVLSEGDHLLKFTIDNKNEANTTVDQNKKILDDSLITIENFKFNDLDLTSLLIEKSVYKTISNGVLSQTNVLGLNGTLSFALKVPIYDWLLENYY
jgi:hypothetical protein